MKSGPATARERDDRATTQRDPRRVHEADQQLLRPRVALERDEEREDGWKRARAKQRRGARAAPTPPRPRGRVSHPPGAEPQQRAWAREHDELCHTQAPWLARQEPDAQNGGDEEHAANGIVRARSHRVGPRAGSSSSNGWCAMNAMPRAGYIGVGQGCVFRRCFPHRFGCGGERPAGEHATSLEQDRNAY